jgi:hypothetical protein
MFNFFSTFCAFFLLFISNTSIAGANLEQIWESKLGE